MWVQQKEESEYANKLKRDPSLTLVKHGRVVIDVTERDVDSSGTSETPELATHVLSLDDHRVVFSGLPVHVCQRHADHAWREEAERERGQRRVDEVN